MGYQLETASEEEISRYIQSLRGLPGGRTEISEYLEEVPSELGEKTLWESYVEEEYGQDELAMVENDFFELINDLEEFPKNRQFESLSRYEEGVQDGIKISREVMNNLESWMDDIESWRNVNQRWLDATEESLDHMWNPFEKERRKKEISNRRDYNRNLEANQLKQRKLSNELDEAKIQGGKAAAKSHFSGVATILAGLIGGSVSGEMAAGVGGGIGLFAMARAKSIRDLSYWNGYKDGIRSKRSEYRVDEMKDNIGDLTVDLEERVPQNELWSDENDGLADFDI